MAAAVSTCSCFPRIACFNCCHQEGFCGAACCCASFFPALIAGSTPVMRCNQPAFFGSPAPCACSSWSNTSTSSACAPPSSTPVGTGVSTITSGALPCCSPACVSGCGVSGTAGEISEVTACERPSSFPGACAKGAEYEPSLHLPKPLPRPLSLGACAGTVDCAALPACLSRFQNDLLAQSPAPASRPHLYAGECANLSREACACDCVSRRLRASCQSAAGRGSRPGYTRPTAPPHCPVKPRARQSTNAAQTPKHPATAPVTLATARRSSTRAQHPRCCHQE